MAMKMQFDDIPGFAFSWGRYGFTWSTVIVYKWVKVYGKLGFWWELGQYHNNPTSFSDAADKSEKELEVWFREAYAIYRKGHPEPKVRVALEYCAKG